MTQAKRPQTFIGIAHAGGPLMWDPVAHELIDRSEPVPTVPGLPRYRCHKEVEAALIGEVRVADHVNLLFLSDANYTAICVSDEYMKKHQPHAGGYYVKYADGYESFSPAEAFEQGYTPI